MNLAEKFHTSDEWHVLKGDVKYGPYTYAELIQMIQQNMVFNFDYVWAPHVDSWTSLADLPDFAPERMAQIVEQMAAEFKGKENPFSRRQHERILCKFPVFVNDNLRLWGGTCENLSEGGALIVMENPILLPGHIVSLHFRNTGKAVPFNCTAEIINKRLSRQRLQHNSGIYYAVRFLQMSPDGEKQIKTWIKENTVSQNKKEQ